MLVKPMAPGAAILAAAALSARGRGAEAYGIAPLGEGATTCVGPSSALADAGILRPFVAQVAGVIPRAGEDPATAWLRVVLEDLTAILDDMRPDWRSERLGVVLGTSAGGMTSAEAFFTARARGDNVEAARWAPRATYFAPFDDALAAVGLAAAAGIPPTRRCQVLAACASGTFALGLGLRWLQQGQCDLVLAGGYDALSLFVAAGFEGLKATTASAPRPFGLHRDGLALGEGAAVVALAPNTVAGLRGARPKAVVEGFGASTDAFHITAPDPTGGGLARAAQRALEDAGVPSSAVGLVSAHGTATPFNDAMEARALGLLFPPHHAPPVHAYKGEIGHALGAAGTLETLAAVESLRRGVVPATVDVGPPAADGPARLVTRSEALGAPTVLKLSAAFGGANGALVLQGPSGRHGSSAAARPAPEVAASAVVLRAFAWVPSAHAPPEDDDRLRRALAARAGVSEERLARLDDLAVLAGTALLALEEELGGRLLGEGTALVVGHGFATVRVNETYWTRLLQRGPEGVDARRFPSTSPNAVAGECALLFRVTGPSLAVGASPEGGLEALEVAQDLLLGGDAPRALVLAVDDGSATTRALAAAIPPGAPCPRGAVAALLERTASAEARGRLPAPAGFRDPDDPGRAPRGHVELLRRLTILSTGLSTGARPPA